MRGVVLLSFLILFPAAQVARAQGDAPLTQPVMPQAAPADTSAVPKDTTPANSAAQQPKLPSAANGTPQQPNSPIVEQIVRRPQPSLIVRKGERRLVARHHRYARRYGGSYGPVDRPALAGVELVAPLPLPGEPPHVTVPTPAYPLESLAAALTTPPPPIVCHPTRRDPDMPDPHLYREVPLECVPDDP